MRPNGAVLNNPQCKIIQNTTLDPNPGLIFVLKGHIKGWGWAFAGKQGAFVLIDALKLRLRAVLSLAISEYLSAHNATIQQLFSLPPSVNDA